MFSPNKRKILKTALSFKYGGLNRATWWLLDEGLSGVADSVVKVVRSILDNSLPDELEILKLTKRKALFIINDVSDSGRSFVAKAFLLNHFSHRLSYHLYARDEAANLIEAKNKGINTPNVYGYGHLYDCFGLVRANVIILENLQKLTPISKVMHTGNEQERFEAFMGTIPLFISLYKANCNHIDINANAVMLGKSNSLPVVYLLDFQHARFHDKPSMEILMFETGYFSKACRKWVPKEKIFDWLGQILDIIGIRDNAKREKMRERFTYYFEARNIPATRKEMARKERRDIF